eukprot:7492742-Lingulodinium_polyedra.AAC.1
MKVQATEAADKDDPKNVRLRLKGDSKRKGGVDELDTLWDGVLVSTGLEGSRGTGARSSGSAGHGAAPA